LPLLRPISRRAIRFGTNPDQLSWLVQAIHATRGNSPAGSIVEVGVARGMTSAFLLEHMKQTGDRRPYVCIDTFSGFLEADVDHEVKMRRSSHGGL